MANFSVINAKGQVTVPKSIRILLGLKAGDRVEFVLHGGETVIRRVRTAGNPFQKYIGVLGTFPGGKAAINAWVRSLRDP